MADLEFRYNPYWNRDGGITKNGSDSNIRGGKARTPSARPSLLDLPGDILSQIASNLDFPTLLRFLSLHSTLLSLTQSHLSPLPALIHQTLLSGPPYPHQLSVLPTLRSYIPDSAGGYMFIEVLVRARPKWILERLEFGRWKDDVWRIAFERRFLRSWRRFKGEDDSWRAVFLRTLGRLEHRNLGCTHEESWTRFLTLHRNGSASINRIYSRLFDPYEIYDELKHQNNFSAQPTQVRVLLHLQDIRIIALGVLHSKPSLFVNPNAHLLLHPPLLRNIDSNHQVSQKPLLYPIHTSRPLPITPRTTTVSTPPSAATNEAYFPLVRTLSPSSPTSTSYNSGSPSSSTSPLRTTFSSLLPGRHRRLSSNQERESDSPAGSGSRIGVMLTSVRSRERDSADDTGRRRPWNFGRARAGSSPASNGGPTGIQNGLSLSLGAQGSGGWGENLTQMDSRLRDLDGEATALPIPEEGIYQSKTPIRNPYKSLKSPLPIAAFSKYPNFTTEVTSITQGEQDSPVAKLVDRRYLHKEIEDDEEGSLWANEAVWGTRGEDGLEGIRMAEWDEGSGTRRRWVGPMILIAQLHPSHHSHPYPPGVEATTRIEGDNVDLGPKGMYASLGFEDLEDIAGWLEFRGGGPNGAEAFRSGLGFE